MKISDHISDHSSDSKIDNKLKEENNNDIINKRDPIGTSFFIRILHFKQFYMRI